jgi:DNA excision repair protein ERCC-4
MPTPRLTTTTTTTSPPPRLIWSRSFHATGEIFLALKRNQEEPDAATAAAVGVPTGGEGQQEAVLNQVGAGVCVC